MTGLLRKDSGRIGFVIAALMSGAIDVPEVRKWAELILTNSEGYPLWLIDLIEFDQTPSHIYETIGFSPSESPSASESRALLGIALARNRAIDTTTCSQHKAIDELRRHPELLAQFKEEFPFLADSINETVEPPQFEAPWEPVTSDFSAELLNEVPVGHVLHGVPTIAMARRADCDDFLFKLDDGSGRYAIVHLTWRKEVDPAWPAAQLLNDWSAFVDMMTDEQD